MSERDFWEKHHARKRTVYATEEVVRFLAATYPGEPGGRGQAALDLGAGSGRHSVLLSRWGFDTFTADYSLQAVANARAFLRQEGYPARVTCCDFAALPFGDDSFELVLPWECIFYGDAAAVRRAVAEVHRILKPAGLCFTNLRSPEDSHVADAEEITAQTFRHRGEWKGLAFTVFDERAARELFADGFDVVWCDRYYVSRRNRAAYDAGWILLLRKK